MATAVENKERKKLAMRIGAAVVFLLIIAAAYFLLTGGEEEEVKTKLGESDSMVPQDPAKLATDGASAVRVYPETVALNPGAATTVFQIQSGGAPLLINDVRFPQEFKNDVSVANIDCPGAPIALQPGASCQVEVKWLSGKPFSTTVEIVAETTAGSNSATTPISKMVPITAATADPNIASGGALAANGVNGAGPNGMPVDGSMPSQPYDGGTQPMPAQPAPASYPEPQMVGPAPQSLREQQRSAYISQRRSGQMTTIQPSGQLNPSARSPYSSWNNIGANGSQSSLPTDMSRVITPDKPITAVISYTIDTTGLASGFTRAVAMVDRDIYGNNGRTIVIPRGSRLVGTVGASEERVGVAWEQLIRPDGVRFVFQGSSADAQGRGGIPGRVNERLLARYGYSLLPSIAGAGLTALLGGNQVTSIGGGTGGVNQDGTPVAGGAQVQDARSIAAQILNQPLQQIAQDIYARKSRIPTQVIVAAGTRITVWAVDDLRLKPAGEREIANQQNQQNGSRFTQQRDVNLGPDQAQRQNNGLQPSAQGRSPMPQQQQDYPDPVPVGRVDENGNYIAPGVNAPTPSTAPLNNRPNTTSNRWGQ